MKRGKNGEREVRREIGDWENRTFWRGGGKRGLDKLV